MHIRVLLALAFSLSLSASALAAPRAPQVSAPLFVVDPEHPSRDVRLPSEVELQSSNNNVAISFHDGRLFMAFRSAPTHFASEKTKMIVISSRDEGHTWDFENEISIGRDLREPTLITIQGKLYLYYMILGTNPAGFDPLKMERIERISQGKWGRPQSTGDAHDVFWEMKERNGAIYLTSYNGDHYGKGESKVQVSFRKSKDGMKWLPADGGKNPVVYEGGWSEVGFDFDSNGMFWGVARNEDGDESGWGSQLVAASKKMLTSWSHKKESDPERYDSPRMFQQGGELFLVARRDIGGPFDQGMRNLPFSAQKWLYLGKYSLRPKATSLYWIDRKQMKIVHPTDLPGCGDTAFPSIAQISPGRFLVANYTSPLDHPDITWIAGQISKKGTGIYLTTLTF